MTVDKRRYQALNERLKDGEQSFPITYQFLGADFGTANGPFEIVGPAGKVGKIVSIDANNVTETFACDATDASCIVGTAADADGYAIATGIPDATAAGDAVNFASVTVGALGAVIEADTTIIVTPVVGVDAGAEAGIATLSVTIIWV